jgi:hypothetical protein
MDLHDATTLGKAYCRRRGLGGIVLFTDTTDKLTVPAGSVSYS